MRKSRLFIPMLQYLAITSVFFFSDTSVIETASSTSNTSTLRPSQSLRIEHETTGLFHKQWTFGVANCCSNLIEVGPTSD